MTKLKMKQVRVVELAQIIDSIPPKELATAKDIRLNVNLVNDLNEAIKELSTEVADFGVKRMEYLKPFQEEYKAKEKDFDEEGKKEFANELDKKFNEQYKEEFEVESKKIAELGEKEVEFELSDEKFSVLKTWFEKYGTEKYQNKRVYVEVADILGI